MEHLSTREKMKDMNSRQKAEYIWYYYRFHIIGTIILIAVITSFVVDTMKAKQAVLGITLMGNYVDSTKLDQLKSKADDALIKDPKKKKEIRFDFLQKSESGMDEMSSVSLQKLTATIAARDVDILILDKKDFDIYVSQGTFMKLTSIPQLSTVNLSGYDLVKGKVKDSDTQDEAYGISVDSLPILKDVSFDTKNKVLCIISNSKNVDKGVEFIKWAFSLKQL